jgi:hypothetical protein
LRCYTLCCAVIYKYNLLDVISWLLAAFYTVVQVMCFKGGSERTPIKFETVTRTRIFRMLRVSRTPVCNIIFCLLSVLVHI